MKILKLTILTAGYLLLNVASCCKEEPNTLPPETQAGKNTFGCLVNGKIWLPEAEPFITVGLSAKANQRYLCIGADQGLSENIVILLKNTNIRVDSTYNLSAENISGQYFKRIISSGKEFNIFYGTDTNNTGQVTLTRFDTLAKIVSGRFSFNAKFKYVIPDTTGLPTSNISITDGRFDVKYLPNFK